MDADMTRGVLLYVIGASGSGKDSLMQVAREALADNPEVIFAHRYITRPAHAGGENHVALSEAEFDARLARKLFAMHWRSHGLRYGLGCELNHWLAKGLTVVVNGSREYLDEASEKYSALRPVLIEVSTEVLRERLRSRGRENSSDIEVRLTRAEAFKNVRHPQLLRLPNNAPLSETGPAFVALIRAQSQAATCA
jgi:ribose 1,5-bisphosphokinase